MTKRNEKGKDKSKFHRELYSGLIVLNLTIICQYFL